MKTQTTFSPADAIGMMAATTAALLRSVLALRPVSLGTAAMSLLGIYLGPPGAWVPALHAVAATLALPVLYLMFRVDFDARLFERLAGQGDMPESLHAMDQAMVSLGLIGDVSSRSLHDRIAGARRLALRAVAVSALQLVVVFLAAIVMLMR